MVSGLIACPNLFQGERNKDTMSSNMHSGKAWTFKETSTQVLILVALTLPTTSWSRHFWNSSMGQDLELAAALASFLSSSWEHLLLFAGEGSGRILLGGMRTQGSLFHLLIFIYLVNTCLLTIYSVTALSWVHSRSWVSVCQFELTSKGWKPDIVG